MLVFFTALSASWASTSLRAQADPLRLKADALAETQAPAGLIVLQGEDNARPWVQTEGLVKLGLLSGDPAQIVNSLGHRRFTPHGVPHCVGLAVHDRGVYAGGARRRPPRQGMA